MNVCETMGYAPELGELIVEIPRSAGTLMPRNASEVLGIVRRTYVPAEFFTDADVKPFSRAYACLTAAATTEFLAAPVPTGHFTSFPEPIDDFHVELTSER